MAGKVNGFLFSKINRGIASSILYFFSFIDASDKSHKSRWLRISSEVPPKDKSTLKFSLLSGHDLH